MSFIRPLLLSSFGLVVACGSLGSEGEGLAPGGRTPSPTGGDLPGSDLPGSGMLGSGGGTSAEEAVWMPPRDATDEDRGAACRIPALPSFSELAANDGLPDPFSSLDGTRIDSADDWTCRRAEISAQVQEYELGIKPPKPENVSGSFADGTLTVTAQEGGTSVSFSATITLPATGTAPYPALIAMGGSSLDNAGIQALGVAMISFPNGDVAEQMNGQSRGRGKFYELYGATHPAGAMMAWAWGVSRLIDALETTPEANIDPDRLGVTGCSRNGKGALVAGAFDERIQLTIPQESGAGGSSLWRVADLNHAAWIQNGSVANQDVQTLQQIVQENVWFRASFSAFSAAATRLPFDHHMVMGLVAPRALFVVNNTDMFWLDKQGSHMGALVAHRIWEGLGIPDTMGSSQVGGHNHCVDVPAAQNAEITAYIQKFLIGGGTGDTAVMYSDGGYTVDDARWVDWSVPALAPAGG